MPRAINYPPVMGAREKFLCSSPFQGSGEVEKLFSGSFECPAQQGLVLHPMPMEGPNPVLFHEPLAQHPVRSHLAQVGIGQGIKQQEEPGPSHHPCEPHRDGQAAGSDPSLLPQAANSRETGEPRFLGTLHGHKKCSFPCSCWVLQPPKLVPTGPLKASKDDFEMFISTPGSSYCWRQQAMAHVRPESYNLWFSLLAEHHLQKSSRGGKP